MVKGMEKSREIREEIFLHTSRGEKERCQTCFTRSLSPPSLRCVCVCVHPDIMWSVDWLVVLQNDGQKGPFSPRQAGWDGICKRQHCYRILSACYCFLHVPVSQSVFSLSLSLFSFIYLFLTEFVTVLFIHLLSLCVHISVCLLSLRSMQCVFTITLKFCYCVHICRKSVYNYIPTWTLLFGTLVNTHRDTDSFFTLTLTPQYPSNHSSWIRRIW